MVLRAVETRQRSTAAGAEMARGELPPVTRLFGRKRSVGARIAGAVALTLAFAVLGFGITTAIYLEQPTHALLLRAPALASLLPEVAEPPAPRVVARPAPPPPALPAIEPQAGSSTPAPVAAPTPAPAEAVPPAPVIAALPAAPPAAAAPARASGGLRPYWVEYGVFVGRTYAHRLQRSLAREGLATVIVATHDRHGRKLLRVRSMPMTDLAAARAAAATAEKALHLAALLHRGSPAATRAPRYRVQFAAFAAPRPAARLAHELRRHGIAADVYATRGAAGKSLFYVRSERVRTRGQALALGARGRPLINSAFLVVEETPPHRRPPAAHASRSPAPRAQRAALSRGSPQASTSQEK
jgi:hypothetical protein